MNTEITRRTVLKHGIGTLAGTVAMAGATGRASAAEPVSSIPANLNGWQKHGIVLEAYRAVGAGGIQSFTSPVRAARRRPLADLVLGRGHA